MIPITISTTHWWDNARGYARRGLLFVLVPLLLACENDDFLSLPTPPGQPDLEILFTRIAVPFTLVQLDSIRTSPTSEDSRSLAGRLQATDLGSVAASTFIEFNVVTPRPEVATTAAYDSVVFQTIYVRSYGAPANVTQAVEIRPLAEPFQDSTIYYRDDQLPTEPLTLGSAQLSSKVTGAPDTLRFRLDDALGQDFFQRAQADDEVLASNSAFQTFFPGIALVPTEDSRFISSFDVRGARLIVYFTDEESNPQTYQFSVANYFNNILGDRSGTSVATLTTPGQEISSPDGRFYLQSGVGVAPKLDLNSVLDSIRGYSSETQSALLNKVELSIGLESIADTLVAPASLFAYNFEPERFRRIPRRDPRSGQFIGYQGLFSDQTRQGTADEIIRNANGQYQLPITNFISALLVTDSVSNELIVAENNFEQSLNQIVTLPDSVYVNVYYSLLK